MVIRLQNVCFEQAAPGIVYFQKSREILAGKIQKELLKDQGLLVRDYRSWTNLKAWQHRHLGQQHERASTSIRHQSHFSVDTFESSSVAIEHKPSKGEALFWSHGCPATLRETAVAVCLVFTELWFAHLLLSLYVHSHGREPSFYLWISIVLLPVFEPTETGCLSGRLALVTGLLQG